MITLKQLVDEHGDMPLSDEVLKLFGIAEPKELDFMMRINDVEVLLNLKNGSATVRRLKAKYRLSYDESVIPASIFAKEYGMERKDVLAYLERAKEKAAAATATKVK